MIMNIKEELIYRIDERIDEIGERVSTIEGKLDKDTAKGIKKHMSEYGTIIALILSIVVASFTVYEQFVVEPKKAEVAKNQDFRNNIESLAKLTSQIAGLDWTNNFAVAQAQAQTLTPQKLSLIEKIEAYGETYPGQLKFSDYLMLANENEVFTQFSKSLKHATSALNVSESAVERANAYWAIARINGRLKNLEQMRVQFDNAISEFKVAGYAENALAVMQSYIQWVGIEILYDDSCIQPRKAFRNMQQDFIKDEVWPATKKEVEKQFQLMVSQSPRDCQLNLL